MQVIRPVARVTLSYVVIPDLSLHWGAFLLCIYREEKKRKQKNRNINMAIQRNA